MSCRNTFRVSNGWDPDQAQPFVRFHLGQSYLQMLSQTTKVATWEERVIHGIVTDFMLLFKDMILSFNPLPTSVVCW